MSQRNRLGNGGRIDRKRPLRFTFNGVVYSFDVVPTGGTPATIDGEAVVIDGMIVVTVDGVSYSVPAVSP